MFIKVAHTLFDRLPISRGQATKTIYVLLAAMIALTVLLAPVHSLPAQALTTDTSVESPANLAACHGVYHIVRPGQTLYSIAAAYGTTAYRIARCNGLASYTVYVGQALLVPTYRSGG